MFDYATLRAALVGLNRRWENLQRFRGRDSFTGLDVQGIQESVIKRFDVALEMSWKLLAR